MADTTTTIGGKSIPREAVTLEQAMVKLSTARENAARARGAALKAVWAVEEAGRAKDKAKQVEADADKAEQEAYKLVNRLVREATKPDGLDPTRSVIDRDVIL